MSASPVVDDSRCAKAREAVSAALDGEATALELLRVRRHLDRCPRCREFAARIARCTQALRTVRVGSETPA